VQIRVKLAVGVAILGVAGVGTIAVANDRSRFSANIDGYQEVVGDGVVGTLSTDANGFFRASLSRDGQTVRYVLRYEGPFNANNSPGATVTQSHIHLGERAVNGGIIVFLCANPPLGPPATAPTPPACPPTEGTVTGELTAASVIGPTGQGITAGEFAEFVRALRAGATYVNIHTTGFTGGEIRGQVADDDDRDRDSD
jgi:CHRD domain